MLIVLLLVNFKDQVHGFIQYMNNTKFVPPTSNFVRLLWSIPQKKFVLDILLWSMKNNVLESFLY